ncbi:hypothetical protein HOLleu_36345 [Holothuria leucospilota]|uniref:Helix-turn-helix domain-containing protein n=1 Tax=Holothuria leucospilota TaxID=206669 RepID=A0A9Q0YP55_HOLLE|nr:hypothetical protein HOLleu_36345 [Holothuria leucospilota]
MLFTLLLSLHLIFSDKEIPFLDVLVKLHSGSIATTLYCKPTDTHGYLNFNSSHHISLKRSIVFSQCIRIKRICSTKSEYDKHVGNLVEFFLNNDYPYPNLCDKGNYVGHTGTKFRLRFNNHKKTVQDKSISYPVSKHFSSEPNHSLSNLRCILLGSNYPSVTQRLKSESKWVIKLSTHTRGLNKDLGILSDFPSVIYHPRQGV